MGTQAFPVRIQGQRVYLVGVKGSGMCALADVLKARGAEVTGSDVTEEFYTDAILRQIGIRVIEGFSSSNGPEDADIVIHSPAYDRETHPELAEARRRGLAIYSYPEALGALSAGGPFVGVAGVHGKSTTTAMIGTLARSLGWPATVVVGTAVPSFGGRASLTQGDGFMVAEACEYRRHFLHYHPDCAVVTSVELDHPDYYRDRDDVIRAFVEMGQGLAAGGTLVYCADDAGAREVGGLLQKARPDLMLLPYGREAQGPLRVVELATGEGRTVLRLAGIATALVLGVPGEHNGLNAAAAAGVMMYLERAGLVASAAPSAVADALAGFAGTRRRAEVIGERDGILVVDDYAHHPTAIRKTLGALRSFYPGRRVVADFMPHTYSRTERLLQEFAACFEPADHVVLHDIYASARERNPGGLSGRTLFDAVRRQHGSVVYFETPGAALSHLLGVNPP